MISVKLSVLFFGTASLINGGTWWAYTLADTSGVSEIIQLGGTGGLVACLLGGIITLWKDRELIRTKFEEDLSELRVLLETERSEHRAEVIKMQEQHKVDISEVTQMYLDEMRAQINALRQETQNQLNQKADQ